MPLTAQSIQDKIDGTNHGDIVKPKTPTGINRFIRWDSSEGTNKPQLYFEYIVAAGGRRVAGIFGLGRLGLR